MSEVYLSLGSNLGDREENLKRAVFELEHWEGIILKKLSPIYETKPVGYLNQDMFLNIAVEVETNIGPYDLLKVVNEIEKKLKRQRLIRWGPRTIDIDILLYDDIELNDEVLTIPHPRMWERAFVLIPLSDINPFIKKGDVYIKDLIAELPDKEGVKLYKENWYNGV
ncbi:2-amino-4-hydroxy-6-hydroxymethyldihydropteridine pyrophosphokinase [Thermoanaerobacter ethanolicus JW 200]|uniref:2-amino-4-hydroxy-6-hydroxymethyldihydropteridine diphosphokinase n=1 Tax=Thermoanaerobacter siderophilus SR4 TaxID=880478 RepID=I8R350_9THEO|nr:2-amino-4-hydroxy-6-hydroxymethyldihydropteridine pyrophosphokinase [Thermoanaerobacter ethanolicus JW 200]EIV99824.1 LOW QUALITY PROTEIN: 2-amino-4-hydroxy-6-hydroxymethyldihydropteridine pyrophosphokinase [Thermoanaerobacter siderophilus SR4]